MVDCASLSPSRAAPVARAFRGDRGARLGGRLLGLRELVPVAGDALLPEAHGVVARAHGQHATGDGPRDAPDRGVAGRHDATRPGPVQIVARPDEDRLVVRARDQARLRLAVERRECHVPHPAGVRLAAVRDGLQVPRVRVRVLAAPDLDERVAPAGREARDERALGRRGPRRFDGAPAAGREAEGGGQEGRRGPLAARRVVREDRRPAVAGGASQLEHPGPLRRPAHGVHRRPLAARPRVHGRPAARGVLLVDEDLAVVAAARHDLAVPGVRPADLPDGAPVARYRRLVRRRLAVGRENFHGPVRRARRQAPRVVVPGHVVDVVLVLRVEELRRGGLRPRRRSGGSHCRVTSSLKEPRELAIHPRAKPAR
ncbi:unnamed protein product, partial [Pelagomonas calceolata]